MKPPPPPSLPGLAPRSIRLVAAAIDVAIAVTLYGITVVGGLYSIALSVTAFGAQREWFERAGSVLTGVLGWVLFIGGLLVTLYATLYQWYLLSTRGQSFGKALVGIRIVSLDGQPAGFLQALFLRSWLFYGLLSIAIAATSSVIPIAGVLLTLLDFVPMVGEDRRCLHDYLAGTQVRWVRVFEVRVGRLVGAMAAVLVLGGAAFVAVRYDTVAPAVRGFLQREGPATATTPPDAQPVAAASSPGAAEAAPDGPMSLPPEPAEARAPTAVVAPPQAEPPTAPEPPPRVYYQYTDSDGVVQVTDDVSTIPERYRARATRF